MPESPRLLQVGSVGATPIIADITFLNPIAGTKRVTLTQAYTTLRPPGYPSRPSFTGASTQDYPRTISSGTTLDLLPAEAAALVAAGAAIYV